MKGRFLCVPQVQVLYLSIYPSIHPSCAWVGSLLALWPLPQVKAHLFVADACALYSANYSANCLIPRQKKLNSLSKIKIKEYLPSSSGRH